MQPSLVHWSRLLTACAALLGSVPPMASDAPDATLSTLALLNFDVPVPVIVDAPAKALNCAPEK